MPGWIEVSDIYDDSPRTLRIGHARVRWPFPVAWMLGGSSAKVFGRAVYAKNRPFWVQPTFRAFHWVRETKWKLLHRYDPRHQYNVIRTGLKPGYYDVDTLMLYGVMALVCRYVEQERDGEEALASWGEELIDPKNNNNPNEPDGLREAQGQKELDVVAIYRWWKHERPANEARRDELLTRLYGKGRTSFKPVANSDKLSELVFKPFEGEEITLHDEFRALEEKIADDEQKYLHLAIDLRGGMWT